MAMLGWLCSCWVCGSWTLTVLEAVLCVVPAAATEQAGALFPVALWPSVDARLDVELECLLPLSAAAFTPPASLVLAFTAGFFAPGFGIPLCASFFATFPPLGMKLAILEVRLLLSSSSISSFASSVLTLLFSFSELLTELSFAELFFVVSARLNVLCAIPLSAILGLLAVVVFALPLAPGRTFPSSASNGSVFEAVSDNFTGALFSGEDLELLLLLNSLSFSSMDLCDAALGGWSLAAPFLALASCVLAAPDAAEGAEFLLAAGLLLHSLLVALG